MSITKERAIEIAEYFVRAQGYTDLAPDPNALRPQAGDVVVVREDGGVDQERLASMHYDQLEMNAYAVANSDEGDGAAFAVIFKCSKSLAAKYGEGCSRYGGAIIVTNRGEAYRRHIGLPLDQGERVHR